MDIVQYVIIGVIGIVTGLLTGLTGASGMSVLITGLLLLNINIRNIIALTFVVTLINSFSAIIPYIRKKNFLLKEALFVSVPAAGAVFLGNLLAGKISNQSIVGIIVIFLLAAGINLTFIKKKKRDEGEKPIVSNPIFLILFGLFSGFIMGIFGGGGGLFIGIVLIMAFRFPIKLAVSTSICVMGLAALSGVILNFSSGRIDPVMAAVITIPSIIVAYFAGRFANKVNEDLIKKILGIYLIAVSVVLIVKLVYKYI